MKNIIILSALLISTTSLFAQSFWQFKVGICGGGLYELALDNFGNNYNRLKIRPTVGLLYLKPSGNRFRWGVEANLLLHAFDFSEEYGGLGSGEDVSGKINVVHLQTSLVGSVQLSKWIALKGGVGCVTRLGQFSKGTVYPYGPYSGPTRDMEYADYFNGFLFAPSLAVVFSIKNLLLEVQFAPSLNRYEKLESHSGNQAKLVSEQITIGIPL